MGKTDEHSFWQGMAEYYKRQRDRTEDALTISVDLVNAILDSEKDGSGINHLQEFALVKAKQLQTMLAP